MLNRKLRYYDENYGTLINYIKTMVLYKKLWNHLKFVVKYAT